MRELRKILPSWQADIGKCVGSVLYSDIGKEYYAKLGWHPFPVNTEIELSAMEDPAPCDAEDLFSGDLPQLCKDDEAMVRKEMARTADEKTQMMLVPDLDHMQWHHRKEEFACSILFGKCPEVKGAMAGQPGSRVWTIWTHRYYHDPKIAPSENTLYLLRIVVENQHQEGQRQPSQAESLRAVLLRAQSEAAEWGLPQVKVWDPTPLIRALLQQTGLRHQFVEREEDGIASLLWFGEGSGKNDSLKWIGNEKYGWC